MGGLWRRAPSLPDRAGEHYWQPHHACDQSVGEPCYLRDHVGAYRSRCLKDLDRRNDDRAVGRKLASADGPHLQRQTDGFGSTWPSGVCADEVVSKPMRLLGREACGDLVKPTQATVRFWPLHRRAA
jgi:hypothetical protein